MVAGASERGGGGGAEEGVGVRWEGKGGEGGVGRRVHKACNRVTTTYRASLLNMILVGD